MGEEFSLQRGGWSRRAFPLSSIGSGVLLASRYRVLRTAAHGSMARIFEAIDERDGRRVALKVLALGHIVPSLTDRFEREIHILKTLEHANLVKAYDSGRTEDGLLFLALEWLDGSDLSEILRQGPMPIRRALAVARGALWGLKAAHDAGVIHRDLKPGNIFLIEQQEPPAGVKLLDFGVAKLIEEHLLGDLESLKKDLTGQGDVVGTPYYMSPEQAQGSEQIDARADLYALGAVLYESLTGRHPFDGTSALALMAQIATGVARPIRELDRSIPESVESFLKRSLARDPSERFEDARTMESALVRCLVELEDEAPTLNDFSRKPKIDPRPVVTKPSTALSSSDELETLKPITHSDVFPDERGSLSGVEPRERVVTVIVADLTGVGAQRRLAFAVFQTAVSAEGGEAQPIRGGLAVGVFGGRENKGDEPSRAVRAGLNMLGLGPRNATDAPVILGMRAAIGTGSLRRAADATLNGEAIESACSLLDLAASAELVIDSKTAQLSGALVDAVPRGEKGHVVLAQTRRSSSISRRAPAEPFRTAEPLRRSTPINKNEIRRRESVLKALETKGDLGAASVAALALGDALADRGEPLTALPHYERGKAHAEKTQDQELLALSVMRLGRTAYATADLGQAVRQIEEARRLFALLGDRRREAEALIRLGAAYTQAGTFARALESFEAARAHLDVKADSPMLVVLEAHRGVALGDGGQIREGTAQVEWALDAARTLEPGEPLFISGLYSVRAMLEMRRDADALELARELHELARSMLPRFAVPLGSALALALARAGQAQSGLRFGETAIRKLRGNKGCEDEDPQRLCVQQAEVLERLGKVDAARAMWARALAVFQQVEARLPEAVRAGFRERSINRRILERAD